MLALIGCLTSEEGFRKKLRFLEISSYPQMNSFERLLGIHK